jgi:Tfp pilus assembly major pilin PilA
MNNTSKSFIWLGLIAFIAIMAYQSYIKRNPIIKNIDQDKEFVDNIESIVLEKPESEYPGNQLNNGESPFDVVYGKGFTANTDHTLTIKNQSASDVVVFLKRFEDEKIIRNHYVSANSEYTIMNIPNSTCYSKFYYGNDWNPTRIVKEITTGGFDNNEEFIDTDEDIMRFEVTEDANYIYSSQFVITLETIITEGQTLQEKKVSASVFF